MKKWLGPVIGAILIVSTALTTFAQGAGEQRVRVQVADPEQRARVKAEFGARHDFGSLGFTADIPAVALPGLSRRPGVTVAPVPYAITAAAANGKKPRSGTGERTAVPTAPVPWGVSATYNSSGLTATSGGAGLVIAVLDTGVAAHLDLTAPAQCMDFSQKKRPLIDGTCKDGNGHGTHVTGTIVAGGGADGLGIWGMAPGATYFAYKVLNDRGSGFFDDIAAAIRMAADQGAQIINLSLGGDGDDPLLRDAVQYAAGRGVLIVAASGNLGPALNTISYPAAYPEVVAVGALTQVESEFGVPEFSSRGIGLWGENPTIDAREIEVAAPGTGVESTGLNGGYAVMSGTSMATPHVVGLAALVWQGNGALTRSWLQSQAQALDIVIGTHTDIEYDPAAGYGFARRN